MFAVVIMLLFSSSARVICACQRMSDELAALLCTSTAIVFCPDWNSVGSSVMVTLSGLEAA